MSPNQRDLVRAPLKINITLTTELTPRRFWLVICSRVASEINGRTSIGLWSREFWPTLERLRNIQGSLPLLFAVWWIVLVNFAARNIRPKSKIPFCWRLSYWTNMTAEVQCRIPRKMRDLPECFLLFSSYNRQNLFFGTRSPRFVLNLHCNLVPKTPQQNLKASWRFWWQVERELLKPIKTGWFKMTVGLLW